MHARILSDLHNAEAEFALLGCLLHDNRQADRVTGFLSGGDFGDPLLGAIYDTIMQHIANGEGAIGPTIAKIFANDPGFISLGGARMLFQWAGSTSAIMPIMQFAKPVRALAVRRRIASESLLAAERLTDLDERLEDVVGALDIALSASLSSADSRPAMSFTQAFDATVTRIRKMRSGEAAPGVHVHGLRDWNDVTGGMQTGQYILLGGRPSMGKTALALAVMRRAAQAGHGVLFISREMDTEQLMLRVLADLLFEAGGRGTFDDVKSGKLSDGDMHLLDRLREETSSWPIVVENPDGLSSPRIAPMIRQHQRQMEARGQNLGLAIIDYLGLLDPPLGKPNREQEVSAISRDIKNAAGSTRVPIIALSQLSRAVEQRDDKHPQLADLRDSGTLEQDADIIVFVYRHQYYLERSEPDRSDVKKHEAWLIDWQASRDRVEIYSAKNRQGEAPIKRSSFFFGNRQAIRGSDFFSGGGGL